MSDAFGVAKAVRLSQGLVLGFVAQPRCVGIGVGLGRAPRGQGGIGGSVETRPNSR
jgi:hypothetical protein